MEGTNASGRRVSLLNESGEAPAPFRHASQPALHSRTSSYVSTPGFPPTPSLIRSDSSDSRGLQTPSPVTPASHLDGHLPDAVYIPSHPELSPKSTMASSYMEPSKEQLAYPILAQHASQGYPVPMPQVQPQLPPQQQPQPQPQPQLFRTSLSPLEEPTTQPQPPVQPTTSSSKPAPKKNQYPCPMAKQYGCADFFTTSGHAARHAKKHTGKKDAFCPECNKAFTRKDNMEQHRRTHQHGRGTGVGESRAKKAKAQMRRTKSSSVTDPTSLPQQAPVAPMQAPRPQLQRATYMDAVNYQPQMALPGDYSPLTPSISHGLDTLAIAASGQQRDIEA
ncbi:MAG: hypothetical protein M1821_003421 [Bathelium mastoideum]|nr:MAG: hypothetical protein M1821_003421 [Bathelium mastoideum]KAI9686021.1 MAG: hypothetical protein M1822_004004 [Bathelium mastoideum]